MNYIVALYLKLVDKVWSSLSARLNLEAFADAAGASWEGCGLAGANVFVDATPGVALERETSVELPARLKDDCWAAPSQEIIKIDLQYSL